MRQDEKQVFEDFKKYANVAEAWALYDTIGICENLYGSEQSAGWFTNYVDFGQQETHSFFKQRTEGQVGLPYTNQQSSDSMDFAFIAHSVGLAVFAPTSNLAGAIDGDGLIELVDAVASHWFAADLPRHMGIQFKVQQDIRIELPALQAPPGYGTTGGGTGFPVIPALTTFGDMVGVSSNVSQGVPVLSNRYPLPYKIGIPRTHSIEGILHLSEYARNFLTGIMGPQSILFNSDDGTAPFGAFPQRLLIQLSLIGERLVQQRGQYHR